MNKYMRPGHCVNESNKNCFGSVWKNTRKNKGTFGVSFETNKHSPEKVYEAKPLRKRLVQKLFRINLEKHTRENKAPLDSASRPTTHTSEKVYEAKPLRKRLKQIVFRSVSEKCMK